MKFNNDALLYNAIKIFYFAEKYDNEKLLYIGLYKHLNIHKNKIIILKNL